MRTFEFITAPTATLLVRRIVVLTTQAAPLKSNCGSRGRRMQRNGSWRLIHLMIAILIGLFAVSGVLAQDAGYTLDWFVLAGGGQASSGAYTLNGVAGQGTAGTLSGGAYSLTGGFLLAETPAQTASQLYLPAVMR